MPRKEYVRKCSYCRRTKLNDREFEHVLWCYLTGIGGIEASALLKGVEPPIEISEKTLRRHYRLIANKLHDEFFSWLYTPFSEYSSDGTDILDFHTAIEPIKDPARRLAAKQNIVYRMHHNLWIHPENNQLMNDPLVGKTFRKYQDTPYEGLDIVEMYRELSKRKFGIGNSIKENLVLAAIRSAVKKDLDRTAKKGWSMSAEAEGAMFEAVKREFRNNPC